MVAFGFPRGGSGSVDCVEKVTMRRFSNGSNCQKSAKTSGVSVVHAPPVAAPAWVNLTR
jgi:hypothetical protein